MAIDEHQVFVFSVI